MSKAKNLYLLLARDFISDPSDNMNSIIKIIEKFNSTVKKEELEKTKSQLKKGQAIAIPYPFFMASSWLFDQKLLKETFVTIKMSVIDPAGKNLGGPEQEHMLPAAVNKVNLNFKSDAFPVTESGTYSLRAELISKSGSLLADAEYPYEVVLEFD